MVGWGAVEISVIEKQEALTTRCPKPQVTHRSEKIERAEEIVRESQGRMSVLHFCVREAGRRHSSASEKTGRLLHLSFFSPPLPRPLCRRLSSGFYPLLWSGSCVLAARENHVMLIQRPHSPPQKKKIQRGGGLSSPSYLGIMWPQGKASVYLFVYHVLFYNVLHGELRL